MQVIACDLADPSQISRLPLDYQLLIHSAADTRFNISAERADTINRDASLNLFARARQCTQLERLAYISTVYASGEQEGFTPETLLDGPRNFANHYERSKWETEQALARDFASLPWQIHRVATVIADDFSGAYTQLNAVHNTLKLLYYGLISLLPGRGTVPLYLVTGDFVARGIQTLIPQGDTHEVFHLCHSREACLTLDQLIQISFAAFLKDENFRKRGLQKPLLVDAASFKILAEGLAGFGSDLMNEAMGSMVPFAKQLFIQKDFAQDKVRLALPDYPAPDAAQLLENLIKNLILKRWKVSP